MDESDYSIEILYRAIKRSQPSTVIQRKGKLRVSSALFKDENGVSVDKKMQRTEETAIQKLKDYFSRRLKGIVKLTELDVNHANAVVIPKPSIENQYHAEIHKNHNEIMLDDIQALQLADSCQFVFFDEEKDWSITNSHNP